MAPRLRVSGRELSRALEKAGFVIVRRRGSHHMLHHPDGRKTVVPVHRGETVGPGLLSKILRDTALSREELEALLRR